MKETTSVVNKETRTPSFFIIIAIVGLLAVLIGFAKTFIIPTVEGTFKAPPIVHIHGAFAFAWVLLFLIQTSLIHFRKYNIHQYLGVLGIFIAGGVMLTMISFGKYVVDRDLNQGLGESSYSTILGVIMSGLIFFILVLLGILKRNDSATHKRLMLLATILVLWPAWSRFRHYFPTVPRPDIWFSLVLAQSLTIVAWVWDKLRNGKIHPTLLYVGLFIILEQSFEVFAFNSPAWRIISKWLYNIL